MTDAQFDEIARRLTYTLPDAMESDASLMECRVMRLLHDKHLVTVMMAAVEATTAPTVWRILNDFLRTDSSYADNLTRPLPIGVVDRIVDQATAEALAVVRTLLNEENWEFRDGKPVRCNAYVTVGGEGRGE